MSAFIGTLLPVAVPIKITIAHFSNSPTKFVGEFGGGMQFWAYAAARFDGVARTNKWYAVLHKFDQAGRHVCTDFCPASNQAVSEAEQIDSVEAHLSQMLGQLSNVEFKDIKIELFQTEIDGTVFGLIDESSNSNHEWVSMEPSGLAFYPPWDGRYDT